METSLYSLHDLILKIRDKHRKVKNDLDLPIEKFHEEIIKLEQEMEQLGYDYHLLYMQRSTFNDVFEQAKINSSILERFKLNR